MTKQEEEKFDEFIVKINFGKTDKKSGIQAISYEFRTPEEVKNWITEHDQREKERLIKEIKKLKVKVSSQWDKSGFSKNSTIEKVIDLINNL